MSVVIGLALLAGGAFVAVISAGVFLLLIKLLSPSILLGLLCTGLALAAAVAWQACCYVLSGGLVFLACLAAASTIAVSARGTGT